MLGDHIELQPARARVRAGKLTLTDRLELVEVDDDVQGVVESLRRIDPGLKMFFNRKSEVFVLYWVGVNLDGHVVEELVGAYEELDPRVVKRIQYIDQTGRGRYDLAKELDRIDAERDAEQERRFHEATAPGAEMLRHTLRKDLGLQGSQVYMGGKRRRR